MKSKGYLLAAAAVVSFILLVGLTMPVEAGVSFAPAVNYGVGTNPHSVATGDFNGDGKLDLATANYISNNVSILLGNGDGTFQTAVNYGVGTNPLSIIVGDFNGDGKLDLAVANQGSDNVSILLGNGDGTFQPPTNFPSGTYPDGISFGDFNGDGKLDLAVANHIPAPNNISIQLGNGNGTFQAPIKFSAGSYPYRVAIGDFNGDGKIDLAISRYSSNNIDILIGNGDGSFTSGTSLNVGLSSFSLTVGDFNSDGKMDIAVANTDENNVSILLGNGNGTFQAAVNYGAGNHPRFVAMGDFNGDGKLDLAVANEYGNNVSILLNTNGIAVSPSPYDFGYIVPSSSSSPQTFTITNYNTGNVTIGTITSNSAEFTIQNDYASNQTIPPGGSLTFQAVFSPTSTGAKSANLTIPSNDPDTPTLTVHVTGGPARLVWDREAFFGGAGDQWGTVDGIIANDGLLYIVGKTDANERDGLVAKFSLDLGTPLWSANWPGVAGLDQFNGITSNNEGIFIVGTSYSQTTDPVNPKDVKAVLLKTPLGGGTITKIAEPHFFSFSGEEHFNGATSVKENGYNYIYATGDAQPCGGAGFILAKFDASGNLLNKVTDATLGLDFNQCFTPAGYSVGHKIITLNGFNYAVGFSSLEADHTYRGVLWKHDANLNLIWRKRPLENSGRFLGITTSGGYLYVVGYNGTEGTSNMDYIIQKYDEDGNLIWSQVSGGSGEDLLQGVVAVGNRLFAVGYTKSQGAGGSDAVILEIDPVTGNTLSTTLFGGALNEDGACVITDGTYLYVLGDSKSFAYNGNSVGQSDFMIIRYKIESGPASNQPVISVAPGSKDFGSVNIGNSSSAQTFTISNNGSADLILSSITKSGTNADQFTIQNDLASGQTITQGNSKTLQVVFSPTSTGAKSAALSIPSNDPLSPTVVSLSGTGGAVPNISVSPGSYNFGTVNVSSSSTAQTFTVSNTGGANLIIGSITKSGADPTQFTLQNDLASGQTIAPAGSRTFQAVFSPTSPGAKSATINIPSNDPDTSNFTVSLNGEGSSNSPPSIVNVQINPNPPVANISVLVSATITDDGSITAATLYYRTIGGGWQNTAMSNTGSTYTATIPAGFVVSPGCDYYIEATDNSSNTQKAPTTAPGTPYSFILNPLSEGQVTPASGSPTTTYTYRVKYYDPTGTPPSMLLVEVDGDLHLMRLAQGSAANGYYQYSTAELVYGSHTYDFICLRSGALYYYPENAPYYLTGPSVTKSSSTITVIATPQNFPLGQLVNLSGQITPGHQTNVSLNFTPPSGSVPPLPVLTNSAGAFNVYYQPDAAGLWQVTASWAGDEDHGGATSSSVNFTADKTHTTLDLTLVSQSIGPNDPLSLSGKLTAQNSSLSLNGLPISLIFTAPDQTQYTRTAIVENSAGQYHYTLPKFSDLTPTPDGTWTVQAVFSGNSNYQPSSSPQYEVNVSGSAGYVILVQGAITGFEGSASHAKTVLRVYHDLAQCGFTDDNIRLYSYREEGMPAAWQGAPTKALVQDDITNWAAGKMNNQPGPLYIIFVGHGIADQSGQNGRFYLVEGGQQTQIVPEEVDAWLDALEVQLTSQAAAKKRFFIYGACRSGSFIPAVSKPGRVIITSADALHDSYRGPNEPGDVPDGEWFINRFSFYAAKKGLNLKEAFMAAKERVEQQYNNRPVTPLLDDNGDGIGHGDLVNNPGGDGLAAANEYIGLRSNADVPLNITRVSPTVYLDVNASASPLLEAWVNDITLLSTIWITVSRPGEAEEAGGGSGQVGADLPVVVYTTAAQSSENSYKWTVYNDAAHGFYGFTQAGTYEVFFYAKDTDSNITAPVKTYVYRNTQNNQAPAPFNLISPNNGAETSTTPVLTWNLASDPNGDEVTYALEISLNSAFNLGLITREGLTLPLYIVTLADNLQDRVTYYWRVRAIDPYGAWTLSTQTWSFYTNNTNSPVPITLQGYLKNSLSQEPVAYGTVISSSGQTASALFNGFYFMQVPSNTSSVYLTGSAACYYTKNEGWVSLGNAVNFTVNKDIALTFNSNNCAAPAVAQLSSACGAAGGALTVTGSNFGGYGILKLNNVNIYVTPQNWSDNQITATLPNGITSGAVTVRANGLNSNANHTFIVSNTPTGSLTLQSANVNDPQGYTSSVNVQANLTYTDATTVELSNDGVNWPSFNLSPVGSGSMVVSWTLTAGDGVKNVQAKFKNCNKEATVPPGQITLNTLSLGGNPPGGATCINYGPYTFTVSGGTGSNSWSVAGGSLPTGLTLNPTTGELTGQPTTAGTFNFTLRVNDGQLIVDKAYSITITSNLQITTNSLPLGTLNIAYGPVNLTAQGGCQPYNWNIEAGPGWLNRDGNTLSGTPTATGDFPVTLKVTDSGNNSDTKTFTLTVEAPHSISGRITKSGSGLSGVEVKLSGAAAKQFTTDASGNYTFTGLARGDYTITPCKKGLVFTPATINVTLTGTDVTDQNFTAKAAPYTISGKVFKAGSTGGLSGVTITLTGGGCQHTTTTNSMGNYSFKVPNGTYTLTPSKDGSTFTPPTKDVTINGANVPKVNFQQQP